MTPDADTVMRQCNRCKTEKRLSEFGRHSKMKDGKSTTCKRCQVERFREWARKNPEKKIAAMVRFASRQPKCPICKETKSYNAQHCGSCSKAFRATKRSISITVQPPLSAAEIASERWKPVPEFEQYEISDMGRLRRNGELRKFGLQKNYPYLIVALWRNGAEHRTSAHRLVLLTFVGPCPDGHEAAHQDGNPANPRLSNMKWATKLENEQDKKRHGTYGSGVRHAMAVIGEDLVRDIRRRSASGERNVDIARSLALRAGHVGLIVQRRIWKHVA